MFIYLFFVSLLLAHILVVIHWVKYNMSTFLPPGRPTSTWARPDFAVCQVLLLVTSGISGCQVRKEIPVQRKKEGPSIFIFFFLFPPPLFFSPSVRPFVRVHEEKTRSEKTNRKKQNKTGGSIKSCCLPFFCYIVSHHQYLIPHFDTTRVCCSSVSSIKVPHH